jgi:hypothetical protein
MKVRIVVILAAGLFGTAAALPQGTGGGPVGYWKFDETAGPAADSAGSAAGAWNGSPSTATSGLPVFSYANPRAVVFDQSGGTDDYVELPNTAALENLQEGDYTISVWVRPDAVPSTPDPHDDRSRAGIVIKTGWHTGIHYNSDQEFIFENWGADDPSDADGNPEWWGTGTWGTRYATGQWYHVCGVWNHAAGVAQIWVNGVMVMSANWPANAPMYEYGATTWKIGIAGPGYADYRWAFQGAIDDLRFFNRVLSGPEIQELYQGLPAPRNLTATASGGTVNLSWTAPAGSLSYTYRIFRATAAGGPYTAVTTTTGTTHSDTVPAAGTYYYVVTAVSSVGESGSSNEANATTGSGGGPGGGTPPPGGDDSDDDNDGKCGCGSVRVMGDGLGVLLAAGGLAALGVLAWWRS